ncbi:MAG: helix-turn-helix domain-containing protein [Treponema lecithinolyticum]|uniref:helix-turn-helix domain-containing protein n=1 Tax=Treponema lecithinolyticum TaxID=53418 RepID=UPI0036122670
MAEILGLENELQSLPAILGVTDTARFLHLSESTIYRLIYAGQLKAYHADGPAWNILKSDLAAFCRTSETL